MFAVLLANILGLAGVTLAVKLRAACAQLGIDSTALTVPAALQACNEAMGMEQKGRPLLAQADALAAELGLTFDAPPPTPPPSPPQKQDPSMPKLVVFDLDFTLWHPELYQLSSGPPFKPCSDGCVLTARGERLDLFPAARGALCELADAGVPIAIASRASEVTWALEIMRLLRVDGTRTLANVIGSAPIVIQGGSKVKHLKHIAAETGIALGDMLFFDNERTNIQEVEKIGPTCVYCPRGFKDGVYREGLALHLGTTSSGRRITDGDVDSESSRGRAGRRAAAGGGSKRKRDKKSGAGQRGGRGR